MESVVYSYRGDLLVKSVVLFSGPVEKTESWVKSFFESVYDKRDAIKDQGLLKNLSTIHVIKGKDEELFDRINKVSGYIGELHHRVLEEGKNNVIPDLQLTTLIFDFENDVLEEKNYD